MKLVNGADELLWGDSPLSDEEALTGRDLLARARQLLTVDPHQALELAEAARDHALDHQWEHVLAQAHLSIGLAQHQLGELEPAIESLFEAARAFETLEDLDGELEALSTVGQVYRNLGEFDLASDVLERVLAIGLAIDNQQAQADALNNLAGIHHARGEFSQALERLERALELRRQSGDYQRQANCLNNIGVLCIDQGDYPRALENLLEARALLKDRVQDTRSEGNCLINIGRVYEDTHDLAQASVMYSEALELANKVDDKLVGIMASVNLGTVEHQLGHSETALQLFRRSLENARQIGFRPVEIAALDGIGSVQLQLGQLQAALEANREALEISRELGDREREIEALMSLGRAHLAANAALEASNLLEQALALARESDRQKFIVDIHELLSLSLERLGDDKRALAYYKDFHRLERSLLSEETERRTKNLKVHFELERARTESETYRLRNEVIREANELLEEKVWERTRELEETRVEVVMRLAVAAEYRDDNTGQHTWRVGQLSALIAQRLQMPPEDIELLRLAARLHDVGKIGISDLIMLKPGKLSPEEFDRIKEHTTIGAGILSGGQSPLLQMAEVVALTHHERWAGGGYPHNLSGESIPLVGRIVSVADVYDALMAQRPYKQPWTETEARAEIVKQSGKQFDPNVVDAFLEVLESEARLEMVISSD